jgi:uncharacterized membrane protein required for colicin V production
MLLWLIIIALFVILGVTSYYKGAIRALVTLVGTLLACFLALPLGPLLKPLVPKVGLTHPFWAVLLPPVVVFFLITLVFVGLSFLVHYRVMLHYKYATDDYTRLRFERLNQRLGLVVGLAGGAIYSILVGLVIYILGYPLVQVTDENSPALQRFLSSVRKDIATSGLDRTLAALDPMPENYYLACDLVGLVYQNFAPLQQRLANYPAFLTWSERPEFKEIATDTALLNLLQTRGPVLELINHPKIVALLQNPELTAELQTLSLKDLYQYLRTGKSAKYDEEKILGWWQVDPRSSFNLARRKNPNMPPKQMAELKQLLQVWIPQLQLMAAPDKSLLLRAELTDQARQIVEQLRAAAEAARQAQQQAAGVAQLPPGYAERYGLMRRGPGAPAGEEGAAQPAQPTEPATPVGNFSGKGTWEREGSSLRYKVSYQNERGQEIRGNAVIDQEEMTLTAGGYNLVFVRLY